MKQRFKISKLMLVSFFLILIIAGGVFYLSKNRFSASTVQTSTSTPSASEIASPKTVDDTNKISISRVPILMYHYIRTVTDPNDTLGANLSVTPDIFSKQMDYLVSNNYQTISLQQLRDGFLGIYKIDPTKKPIVITFDDGYDDAYTEAYPILKKHNFIGVFYIIAEQIGQSERMTQDQIIELDKNGMIVGSHTMSHLDLTTISQNQANSQTSDSKLKLESIVGHPILDFCYPAGKYNDDVISILESTGYKSAVTTKSGISDTNSNLFELPRIRMQNDTNLTNVLK